MKKLKESIHILIIVAVFFCPSLVKAEVPKSVNDTISQTLYQIKVYLTSKSAPSFIEDTTHKAINNGAVGLQFHKFYNGDMGWSFEDSKGNEMVFVIISFINQQATRGKYLGPLASYEDAKELHKWHKEVLSNHYKHIESNKYDMGDTCIANMELFKGSTGAGRTSIVIECK